MLWWPFLLSCLLSLNQKTCELTLVCLCLCAWLTHAACSMTRKGTARTMMHKRIMNNIAHMREIGGRKGIDPELTDIIVWSHVSLSFFSLFSLFPHHDYKTNDNNEQRGTKYVSAGMANDAGTTWCVMHGTWKPELLQQQPNPQRPQTTTHAHTHSAASRWTIAPSLPFCRRRKNKNVKSSGAFVFGVMSFFDKVSNGAAVMIIQTIQDNRFVTPNTNGIMCMSRGVTKTRWLQKKKKNETHAYKPNGKWEKS